MVPILETELCRTGSRLLQFGEMGLLHFRIDMILFYPPKPALITQGLLQIAVVICQSIYVKGTSPQLIWSDSKICDLR